VPLVVRIFGRGHLSHWISRRGSCRLLVLLGRGLGRDPLKRKRLAASSRMAIAMNIGARTSADYLPFGSNIDLSLPSKIGVSRTLTDSGRSDKSTLGHHASSLLSRGTGDQRALR